MCAGGRLFYLQCSIFLFTMRIGAFITCVKKKVMVDIIILKRNIHMIYYFLNSRSSWQCNILLFSIQMPWFPQIWMFLTFDIY